jgi:hypothetical protein
MIGLGRTLSASFNFVTERLAVGGGISSKADVDQIVGAGITHVIDMRAEFDDDTLDDNRIPILWLPQAPCGLQDNTEKEFNLRSRRCRWRTPKCFCIARPE